MVSGFEKRMLSGMFGLLSVDCAKAGEVGLRLKVDVIVTTGPKQELVEAGGLMSYGPNFASMFRRAAEYVHKILRGAKPADLPVEQPTKFDLVINLTTAKALGLNIPESFLLRADEIIE
jgi:ABC-type uncharacterized transport system substrate-binding protein